MNNTGKALLRDLDLRNHREQDLRRGMLVRMVFLLLASSAACSAQAIRSGEPEPKRVLVLYGERLELPALHAVDLGLREAFASRGGVEVFTENFDSARFPVAQHTIALIDWLRDRYGAAEAGYAGHDRI